VSSGARALAAGWTKLSSFQRVCVFTLLAVGAGAAVLGTWSARSERYQTLVEARPTEESQHLNTLLALLDSNGISWRSTEGSAGKVKIEVRRGEEFHRALFLAADQGFEANTRSVLDWLFDKSDFLESPERLNLRLDESKRWIVERTIRWNPSIASANLFIQRGRRSAYVRGKDREDSAAVALRLRSAFERLSDHEAATIRKLISGAFTIPVEKIEITDDRGNSYRLSTPAMAAQQTEEELLRKIRRVVEELYQGVYRPQEFKLGVMVRVAGAPGSPASRSADAPVPPAAAAAATGAAELKADVAAGESQPQAPERSDGPAPAKGRPADESAESHARGEVTGVRVNVVLDMGAVKRVLEQRALVLGLRESGSKPSLATQIEAYESEQEAFLARQLPMPDVQVTVQAQVFHSVAGMELRPSFLAERRPATFEHWPYVSGTAVVVAFAAVLAFLLGARRRGRSGAAGRSPPRGEAVVDAAPRIAKPSARSACGATLESVRSVNSVVAGQPDVAAAVLRLWMGEDGAFGAPPEGNGEAQLRRTAESSRRRLERGVRESPRAAPFLKRTFSESEDANGQSA
jgi:flagellar biosynthesis/type III secretory pathway M-ring protein FliF/YscJ